MGEAKALNKLRQPRMNYRLKDYVNGIEGAGGSDAMDQHYQMNNEYMMMPPKDMMTMMDEGSNHMESNQNQHYYNYPHHMNTNNGNVGGNNDDDVDKYKRPTPRASGLFSATNSSSL